MTDSTSTPAPVEQRDERNYRPATLTEFVGQGRIKQALAVMLGAAQKRRLPLEHVLFHGGPGLGKTTLAAIIANEMRATLRELAAPSLQKPGDLASVLVLLREADVLFLDEIHAMKGEIAEILYSAMEDFKVSILAVKGEPPITLPLQHFTLVGATTDYGQLPGPLRDRFGQVFPLDLYTETELSEVVARAADKAGLLAETEAVELLAQRARGTPRVALRLFRRCYDLATVEESELTADLVQRTLELLRVDARGLDEADRRYLNILANNYQGGPVGPKSLAASSGLDQATIETTIEPWLMRSGLLIRTRRGRQITPAGLDHLALPTAA